MKTQLLYAATALAFSAIPATQASAQTINDLEFPLKASRIQELNEGVKLTCASEWAAANRFQAGNYGPDRFLSYANADKTNFINEYNYAKSIVDARMDDPRAYWGYCTMNYIISNY